MILKKLDQHISDMTAVTVTAYMCRNKKIQVQFPYNLTKRRQWENQQCSVTRDFTCSVREFTSSAGSIHVSPYVNSPDYMNKFCVSTRIFHVMTNYQPV